MPANPDPDQDLVIDLARARRCIEARLNADGTLCRYDQAALAALDLPIQTLSLRVRVRSAFESLMRNGLTRRTGDKARESGLMVIVDNARQVTNVVALHEEHGPQAA